MISARPQVALVKCPDYSRANVERAVGELLGLLGGIGAFVRPGTDVFLKVNLLAGRPPEDAVTTHPEVVRAVGRAVLDAGAKAAVGDSPGIGSLAEVAAKSGITAVANELGIPLEPLTEAIAVVRPPGAQFRKLLLARRVLDADLVINLPKVKTHQQMFLTLAVKNLFGCVVGREKIAWHLNAGRDARLFARALVEICHAVAPGLNIADGAIGMEGSGPSHGVPRSFGFLAASADPFALDAALTWLLGFRKENLPVLVAADEARADGLDIGTTNLADIEWVGCNPSEVRAHRVRPPPAGRLMFFPGILARVARRLFTVRPRVCGAECRLCGACTESCPAKAMKIVDGRLRINDTLCIRCFCCQELCPRGAVRARQGVLSRLLRS